MRGCVCEGRVCVRGCNVLEGVLKGGGGGSIGCIGCIDKKC